jgi:hypothetical protein
MGSISRQIKEGECVMSSLVGSFPCSQLSQTQDNVLFPLFGVVNSGERHRTTAIAGRILNPRLFERLGQAGEHIFSYLTLSEMVTASLANPKSCLFGQAKAIPKPENVLSLEFKSHSKARNLGEIIALVPNLQKITTPVIQGLDQLAHRANLSCVEFIENVSQLITRKFLRECQPKDNELAFLIHCPNLSTLSLQLGLSITSAVLPILRDCPQLSTLIIDESAHYEMDNGKMAPGNVRRMLARKNTFLSSGDLAVLGDYPNLQNLTLICTDEIASGLQHLGKCKKLFSLALEGWWSQPLSLDFLSECRQLRHLKLKDVEGLKHEDFVDSEICGQLDILELLAVNTIRQPTVDHLSKKYPTLTIVFEKLLRLTEHAGAIFDAEFEEELQKRAHQMMIEIEKERAHQMIMGIKRKGAHQMMMALGSKYQEMMELEMAHQEMMGTMEETPIGPAEEFNRSPNENC